MDGRGGCCTARYTDGFYDMSKVDRIMLQFRPIAPKPALSGSDPKPEINNDVYTKAGRRKRKTVKHCSNTSPKSSYKKKKLPVDGCGGDTAEVVVTLPLMPETPEKKDYISPAEEVSQRTPPFWLSFSGGDLVQYQPPATARSVKETAVEESLLGSCVTVECVSDTWLDRNGLGSSDEERIINLVGDTCPGIISDDLGRVTWTNEAYRKLAMQHVDGVGEGKRSERMVVWVVMKDKEMIRYPAFTCRARLQYTCRVKERSSLTVPCDVWRMDGGGFAWRLDTKAALCLGR